MENFNSSLKKKFEKGLKKYDMKFKDLEEENWHYCGGDGESHLNYWKLQYGDEPLPSHENKCICSHNIQKNFYITDDEYLLVVGSCCITKFINTGLKRTCDNCKEIHQNRKNNLCNRCRRYACKRCGKYNPGYTYCYPCYLKNKSN